MIPYSIHVHCRYRPPSHEVNVLRQSVALLNDLVQRRIQMMVGALNRMQSKYTVTIYIHCLYTSSCCSCILRSIREAICVCYSLIHVQEASSSTITAGSEPQGAGTEWVKADRSDAVRLTQGLLGGDAEFGHSSLLLPDAAAADGLLHQSDLEYLDRHMGARQKGLESHPGESLQVCLYMWPMDLMFS